MGTQSSWVAVRWASLTKRSTRSANMHVTLKVISERYLGDESARLRFLREARAAAGCGTRTLPRSSTPGRSGEQCFYAMEFVEGETSEAASSAAGRCRQVWPWKLRRKSPGLAGCATNAQLRSPGLKPDNI